MCLSQKIFKRLSAMRPSTRIYPEEQEKNRPELMNPFVAFVIFVVQAVALNQTCPFQITAKI